MGTGAFSGIATATIGGRLPNMIPGFMGVVTVKKVIYKPEDQKGNMPVIVEFIIKTTNLPVELPVGTVRSWYRQMTSPDKSIAKSIRDTALGELKAFLLGITGLTEKDHERAAELYAQAEGLLEEAVGEKQPLAGFDVGLQTLNTPSTKTKKDYTKFIWSPKEAYLSEASPAPAQQAA